MFTRRDFVKMFSAAILAASIPIKAKANEVKNWLSKFKKVNTTCVWQMGTPCEGNIYEATMFTFIKVNDRDPGLTVPVCEKHLIEHKKLMALQKSGIDIELLLKMTSEERNKLIEQKNIDWESQEA